MDLQDIWQEHRRFILGVFGGLIVFLIAQTTVEGLFGAEGAVRKCKLIVSAANKPAFDKEARAAAQLRNEELTAEFAALRDAVAFVPADEFLLAGKGDPDTYFPQVARRVRTTILQAAQSNGVELADQDLVWQAPVGAETGPTLVALGAMEQAALRLLDASERVLAVDPEALGVQSIESLKYETRVGNSARRGRTRSRGRGAVDEDLVEAQRISFVIRCDLKTLQAWLESLRGQNPPLALDPGLKVLQGDQVGDPLSVRGSLAVLTVKDPTQ